MKMFTGFLLLVFATSSYASDTQVIRFPEKDLARESVLPVFKNTMAVKKRNVPKEGRFEIGLLGGQQLNEAFYEPYSFGGSIHYHINEQHGIELMALFFTTSESQYVKTLNQDTGGDYDFEKVPNLENMLLASWEYTPFYGKISLTKQTVYNTAVHFNLIAGFVNNGESSNLAFGAGLGQKIFFSPNWGVRADLRTLFYKAVDPFSNTTVLTTSATGDFEEENKFNILLNLGIFAYLPSL
ncbi:MAG: outer membrane beta-barrel domain-containing protein [Bdellovibrionales bacterium]|nr:outer membrane beta-barrel domain-containing protein [Bdellovibrionales bacterium]